MRFGIGIGLTDNRGGGESPVITATTAPSLSALTDGDTLEDQLTGVTLSNFQSTEGDIVSVTAEAFKDGVSVGVVVDKFAADFIVDPENGDWSADYPDATVVTSFDALAASSFTMDQNVGLATNSRLAPRSNASVWSNLKGTWKTVGVGRKAFIDGSLPISEMNISAHSTYANVYVVEITHVIEPFYTSNVESNGPHVGMWWETASTGLLGEYLEPYFDAADIPAGEQFVSNNPGRCFVHKVGSTITDVRAETSGETLRYVFQLSDSGDPKSGGELRYANYHQSGTKFGATAKAENIIFGRNTRKDCTSGDASSNDTASPLPLFIGCAWIDPGCHAVVGPSNWQKNVAYSRTPGSRGAGGAWHNYTGISDPRVPDIADSYIRGYSKCVYSHGSGQTPYVISSMTGRRLRIEDCGTAFAMTTMEENGLFEDIVMTRVRSITGGAVTVKKFTWQGTEDNDTNTNNFGSEMVLEDGVLDFNNNKGYWTKLIVFGETEEAVNALGPFVYRRITAANESNSFNLQSQGQEYLNVIFQDVIYGKITHFTNDPDSPNFLRSATMVNSYLGPIGNAGVPVFNSLVDYQSHVPGAADDVILFDGTMPSFSENPLLNPTLINLPAVVSAGMGVDPVIIQTLTGTTLQNVPTLSDMELL